ncbi:MAG: hypothetical protein IKU29_00425 [Parabacteroides sp.]|nr:hypothetical protein [Parabacteroides sp.]
MSSKYTSIQNECLDLIEAYSEEQYHAEMAVIDSVLDMFDKISCLMEYSNPDNISIPDCSMFMESTFFQERNEGDTGTDTSVDNSSVDNKEEAQPEPQQQQQQNTQNQANNNNNQTNTTNREQYNKDHPFRKMNDEGKIENIFISILKFIPRLIALPIRMLISYIKKKKNNNASETMKNMTEEQRQKIAEEINNLNGESGDGWKIEGGEIKAYVDQLSFSINGDGQVSTNVNLDNIDNSVTMNVTNIKQAYGEINPQSMLSETIMVTEKERSEEDNKNITFLKDRYIEFENRKNKLKHDLELCLKDLDICKKRVEECIHILESTAKENTGRGEGYRRTLVKATGARRKDLNSIKNIIQQIKSNIMELDKLEDCENRALWKYLGLYEQIQKMDPAGIATRKANQNINAVKKNKDNLNNKEKIDTSVAIK